MPERSLALSSDPSPASGRGEKTTLEGFAGRCSDDSANAKSPLPQAGEGGRRSGEGKPRPGKANRETLLCKAKALRSQQTEAEQRLWYFLRGHRFLGLKFKRQKPVGAYIADFICHESNLIVEVDGGQHAEQRGYDAQRTAFLNAQGFRVLRFWNNEVLQQTEVVLEAIRQAALSPDPSPASGRGEKTTLATFVKENARNRTEGNNYGDSANGKSPLPRAGEGGRRPGDGNEGSRP